MLLEGAGLIDVNRADEPLLYTDPQSLSFHYLNVNKGAAYRTLAVTVADVGGGFGTWSVELEPQAATAGATIDLPSTVDRRPRRLRRVHRGRARERRRGRRRRLRLHRPAARDGHAPDPVRVHRRAARPRVDHAEEAQSRSRSATRARARARSTRTAGRPRRSARRRATPGPPLDENGAEQLYVTELAQPAVNMGVAVIVQSGGSLIDPFFLASRDENDVTGYTGTPVNVNGYMFSYRADVQAAGIQYPRQGQYFVAVDSGKSDFTGQSFAGQYLLHAWLNDVLPPLAAMVTTTVAAGHPTIVARTIDLQAGVDPLSLVFAYGDTLIGAAAYDPISGLRGLPAPGRRSRR